MIRRTPISTRTDTLLPDTALFRSAARESAGVVGGEYDVDPVPDIGPVGMVVGSFGGKGDPGHEAERLIEIAELEAALDSVTLRIESPIAQLLESRLAPGCV